ncbi:MAG: gluconate 2-dehydrogenase subunit 3 family protein [Acidobacteriia bacterium]|nr:gluconate 2-dehydrogenase subunit 3 family protein [Terriglobia bacterium]
MNRRDLLQFGALVLPRLPALAQGTQWQPQLFDAHQNDTVIALSEWIIPATDTPGAKAALVNRYMDLLLREGPEESRIEFLSGLGWLDGYALSKHSQPFTGCSREQQEALLRTLDSPDFPAPGRSFFGSVKMLTARIYYATQPGFQEMNKGGRVPTTYGCTHNGHA